ncbi:MAG: translesion error-prone DNA polymerase V autoproteolytic subunit [Gallionella sp.]|nr:translesion error-prone DNA polymerase V autoproteolytic subunit [Gallionella sp.]MDD4946676.1 translesion error-prone DNA polymerase V autoproteolytic subunit [Gallionella sp.]
MQLPLELTSHPARRCNHPVLLSMTRPNREMLHRQRALLRRAVPAGFPSPADDYVERRLSLDEHLVEHRESTFFMRVAGESMCGMGIYDGDLLVVDRALPATPGSVVIAVVDGEFTVKQLLHTPDGMTLRAAHPDYPDLHIRPEQDFSIWGVVRWNVHKL